MVKIGKLDQSYLDPHVPLEFEPLQRHTVLLFSLLFFFIGCDSMEPKNALMHAGSLIPSVVDKNTFSLSLSLLWLRLSINGGAPVKDQQHCSSSNGRFNRVTSTWETTTEWKWNHYKVLLFTSLLLMVDRLVQKLRRMTTQKSQAHIGLSHIVSLFGNLLILFMSWSRSGVHFHQNDTFWCRMKWVTSTWFSNQERQVIISWVKSRIQSLIESIYRSQLISRSEVCANRLPKSSHLWMVLPYVDASAIFSCESPRGWNFQWTHFGDRWPEDLPI